MGNFVVQFRYLTLILRCLTPFVLSALVAYITVVSSALFANAYRDGVATLGESAGPLSRQ